MMAHMGVHEVPRYTCLSGAIESLQLAAHELEAGHEDTAEAIAIQALDELGQALGLYGLADRAYVAAAERRTALKQGTASSPRRCVF